MSKPLSGDDSKSCIVAVTLDEESIGRSGPDIEHERAIAIYDLIEQNLFAPEGAVSGPFTLHLAITGNRLAFDIRREDGAPVVAHLLSLTPFRRIVKDYFMICDSYYQAIRTATTDKIEAIGDYVGGSNHVLPTARSARFSSGLGVLDFMKRTSILKCGPDQLRALGPAAMTLGKAEGLDAHSRSVGLRLNLP